MSIHRVSEGSLHVGGFANSIENHVNRDQPQPDVLLLSQRRIADLAAYCLAYEFEDTFAAVTDAQRIDVTDLPALEFSRRAYKLARLASGSAALARRLAPSSRAKVVLERDFDLFFPVFSHSYESYSLATIPNCRQRCRKAACLSAKSGRTGYRNICSSSYLHLTTSSSGPATRSRMWRASPIDHAPACRWPLMFCVSRRYRSINPARSRSAILVVARR